MTGRRHRAVTAIATGPTKPGVQFELVEGTVSIHRAFYLSEFINTY